jgi:hypothetical protein
MHRLTHPSSSQGDVRSTERGSHPLVYVVGAVLILAVVLVVLLLLRKPAQVTSVAVLGTSPSASASATAVPVTVAPTLAPTRAPTPASTSPAFASFSAPHTVACNGQAVIYPHMTWSVRNATGITISIDAPDGIFASYGPSGATDQQSEQVPFACSKTPLEHMYFFTTTGGTGPAVTRSVTITGTP